MASLSGVSVASSYTSLLKLNGNTDTLVDGNGSNAIQIVDGDGTASPLYLNTDRLGIGGQPSEALDVTGNGKISGNFTVSNGILTLGTADSSSGHINAFENMSFNIDTDNDDTNRFFEFAIDGSSGAGTELMRLTEAGQLGIGATTIQQLLHLEKDDADVGIALTQSGQRSWSFGIDNSDSDRLKIGYSTTIGTNTVATFTESGQLGIGIQPATALDVSGGLNSAHSTFSGQAGRGLLIETQSTTNNDDTVVLNAQTSTGEIAFETNSTEKMRINSSTVIIGTHNSNAHRLAIESRHSTVPFGQIVAGSSDQNQAVGFQFTVRDSNGDERDKMFLTDTGLGIGTTPLSALMVQTTNALDVTTAPTGSISFGSPSATLQGAISGRQTSNTTALQLMGCGADGNTSGDMIFNVRENNNSTFATLTNSAFKFQHFSTDLVTILRNGSVGIGTSPLVPLHISKATDGGLTEMFIDNSAGGGSTNETVGIRFLHNGATAGGILAGRTEDFSNSANRSGHLIFKTNNNDSYAERMRIESTGNILPGTDDAQDLGSSSKRFDDIHATNGTIQTSDERLKDNIADSSLGLDFVNALRPVKYQWKDYTYDVEKEKAVEAKEAVYETVVVQEAVEAKEAVMGTRQKTVSKDVEKTKIEIVEEDGKYVQKEVSYTETVEEPQYEEVNLYDEDGEVIGSHKIPVMEEYEVEPAVEAVEEITEERLVSEAIEAKDAVMETKEKTFARTHFGLIAQEVEQVLKDSSLTNNDFAGLIYDEDADRYGMRYNELIAPLIKAVQELSAKVTDLENK